MVVVPDEVLNLYTLDEVHLMQVSRGYRGLNRLDAIQAIGDFPTPTVHATRYANLGLCLAMLASSKAEGNDLGAQVHALGAERCYSLLPAEIQAILVPM